MLVHAPILETTRTRWHSEADCLAAGRRLASDPKALDAIVTLHGPLGAGKTTFVRGLLRALGVTGRVKSPTYALLEPYEVNGLQVSHIDLYRLNDPDEWAGTGLRDVLAQPGLKLIEWPSQAGQHLPTEDLRVTIDVKSDDVRDVVAQALSPRGRALAQALAAGQPT